MLSLPVCILRKPVENIMLPAGKIRHKMLVASINCYILAIISCYQRIKLSAYLNYRLVQELL